MKNSLIAIGILGVIIFITFFAIGGFEGNLNSALAVNDGKSFNEKLNQAKSSNKKVLINVYTDWCGWCKKMDRETYKDAEVNSLIENDYVFIKLNAESNEEITYQGNKYTNAQFVSAFGITGYPATLFLSSNGEPITVVPGYIEPVMFTKILNYIAKDVYKKKTFDDYLKEVK